MPWRLLADVAAAGVLTTLEVYAPQVQHLLAGGPTAAATAGQEAIPGLAATLSGLRCLKVGDFNDKAPELRQVGRLLGACSGLTKLMLDAGLSCPDTTPLLEGMEEAAAAATAAAAAEVEAGGGSPAAPAVACPASATVAAFGLPGLQHLELMGPMSGLIEEWMGSPAPPQLTSLRLAEGASCGVDLACLTACSGLQELEVLHHGGLMHNDSLVLPVQLTQLKGLTKLVLERCDMGEEVPPVVWQLTQLRHLSLKGCYGSGAALMPEISDEISSLHQLTCLNLDYLRVQDAPEEIGMWLPQLRVLGVNELDLDLHMCGITQFAGLTSLTGGIEGLAHKQQLAGLKELFLYNVLLEPPYDGVSCLTALEKLALHRMEEGRAVVTSTPLPRLSWLDLTADDPFRVAAQLVGSGQHLTYLELHPTLRQPEVSSIHQLKVLPVLKVLKLGLFSAANLAGIGPWLCQQPQVTSLDLGNLPGEVTLHLSGFPPQLKRLVLPSCSDTPPGAVLYDLPEAVAALTGLQELRGAAKQLPAWLSSLTGLRQMGMDGPESHWEVVGQLPLLRRLRSQSEAAMAAVLCMPHLCWA
jgi:hypothetical protein